MNQGESLSRRRPTSILMRVALAVATLATLAAVAGSFAPAGAGAPTLAPVQGLSDAASGASTAPPPTIQDGIGPGSALHQLDQSGDSSGYICTAAFLLRDPATAKYYLSTAGHCLVLDPEDPAAYTGADNADKLKEEILVCVAGCIANAVQFGTYISLRAGEGYHPVTYARSGGVGEDFGIIEIPAEHRQLLRPALPQWGGPTSMADDGGGLLVHYGHGSYCCPEVGAVATRTPADQGRVGYFLSNDGSSFEGVGWVTGGDSGSGIALGVPDATGLVRGTAALGVITHATQGTGSVFSGTMLKHGIDMVREATGLQLELVLEGDPLTALPQGGPNGTLDIAILRPAPGATVRPVDGAIRIDGTASLDQAVNGTRVEVAIDDPSFGFDSRLAVEAVEGDMNWSATWFPGQAVNGLHTLRARLVGPDGAILDQANQTVKLERGRGGSSQGSLDPTADDRVGDGAADAGGSTVDVPGPGLPALLAAVAAGVALAAWRGDGRRGRGGQG